MKTLCHISKITAAVFAASLSFSLVACDDSSSSVSEGTLEPSGTGYALGQEPMDLPPTSCNDSFKVEVMQETVPYRCSDTLETDGVYFTYKKHLYTEDRTKSCEEKGYLKCENSEWTPIEQKDIPPFSLVYHNYSPTDYDIYLTFKKCNDENEGQYEVRSSGNGGRYSISYTYYRCEKGDWVERPAWAACDTTGVSEGEICRVQTVSGGSQFGTDSWKCYKYDGKGSWKSQDCPTMPEKECNEENIGDKEKIAFTNDTLFYMCSEGSKWAELSEGEYNCSTGNESVGDTCSFERDGQKKYFRYDSIPEADSRWVEAAFDPELGFCTENDGNYWRRRYAKKGEEYYYCDVNSWLPTKFVPRQYTDSRKEGLTDEEYDMLDLPKDAKVGDRASGLLEYCEHNKTLGFDYPNVYDYCFSPNHYRYRGDGKWSRETIEDIHADDIDLDSLPCGGSTWCCTETEGMKQRANGYYFDEPEVIYQCISGETVLVERLWNRYEKK